MRVSFSMSVATAAAAAEAATTAGAFLAEVDVIVDGGVERVRVELHVVAREHLAFPRPHADMSATAEQQRREDEEWNLSHGVPRIQWVTVSRRCRSASRPALCASRKPMRDSTSFPSRSNTKEEGMPCSLKRC